MAMVQLKNFVECLLSNFANTLTKAPLAECLLELSPSLDSLSVLKQN